MFIEFGHLTKKCLLFLAVPIAMLARLYLTYLTDENMQEKEKNMFFHPFLKFIGRSIHGIVWFIFERSILSNKKKEQINKDIMFKNLEQDDPNILYENESKRNNSVYSIYESYFYEKIKMEKKNNYRKICLLILVCLLDFFFVVISQIIIETRE